MRVARQLRVPMVGSFHTDLAAYADILSGSGRLGGLMREYMRWPYGRCARVLVPSDDTRRLLIGAQGDPRRRFASGARGVDSAHFHPRRALGGAAPGLARVSPTPGAALRRPRVAREGPRPAARPSATACPSWGSRTASSSRARADAGRAAGATERCRVHRRADAGGRGDGLRVGRRLRVSRAAPTRPATSCSRRRRAGCRSWSPTPAGRGRTSATVAPATSSRAWSRARGRARSHRCCATRTCASAWVAAARAYAESRTWEHALEPLFRTYRELAAASAASSAMPDLLPRGAPLS